MSADNGIYILRTPKGGGFEYRVAHLQGIDDSLIDHLVMDDENVHIENARRMWKDSPVFYSEEKAYNHADKLLQELCICEYGISYISILKEFDNSPIPDVPGVGLCQASFVNDTIVEVSKNLKALHVRLGEIMAMMEELNNVMAMQKSNKEEK